MNRCADYRTATNAAYELLYKLKINSLPIDFKTVMRRLPYIHYKTYSDFGAQRGMSFDDVLKLVQNRHGFVLIDDSKTPLHYLIIYNETKDVGTKRFTIAHELGHIILEHDKEDYVSEQEANCFARNFLCPVPISIEKRLFTCSDYIKSYHISSIAAEVCIAFRRTDFDNITTDNYIKMTDLFMLSYKDTLAEIEEEIDREMGIILPAEYYRSIY